MNSILCAQDFPRNLKNFTSPLCVIFQRPPPYLLASWSKEDHNTPYESPDHTSHKRAYYPVKAQMFLVNVLYVHTQSYNMEATNAFGHGSEYLRESL